MKLIVKNGITSLILRVKILDTAVTTGAGKTGLTEASVGLIISTIADNEATATAYTQAAGNIETITTLGTFAAPTAGKCRFKEVDATNHPGLCEVHIANARWAVSGARSVIISVSGPAGAAQVDAEIQLEPVPVDVSSIWTTALTEAYRTTGATGTAAELLYEILQNITEFTVASTTKTVKKLDGSTTAKTYTLDSATTPLSITETT